MASSVYSSSLQSVNSSISNAQDFLDNDRNIRIIESLGAIANSIDRVIPDDAKGPDKIRKIALKSTLELLKNFFNELFFGKRSKQPNKKPSKPSDIGILRLLSLLSRVDLCAIASSTLNNLGGSTFNPNPNPIPTDPKWKIQKAAYDVKTIIDSYYVVYGTAITPASKQGLNDLVSTVLFQLDRLSSASYLADPQIQKAYPTSKIANNTILEFVSYINKTTPDFTLADNMTINKINEKLNLLKSACDLIIGLQSPANVARLSDTLLNTNFNQAFQELDKILTPKDNIVKVLKDVVETLKSIQRIGAIVLRTLNLMQIIITILKVIIKVFRIITQFFGVLPIPNIYTTGGITTTLAKGERTLSDKIVEFTKILSNINDTLKIISNQVVALITLIDLILPRLSLIVERLESCNRDNNQQNQLNSPEQILIAELKDSISGLQQTRDDLNKFVENFQRKQDNQSNSYGGYTIQILTEEIADQTIQRNTIPRRFGIALDNNNQIVVESTPTFASDDNIIREEVKLLLSSKGLIEPQNIIFDPETLAVLNEASNWLYDDTVSVDDITIDTSFSLDSPENENENEGLGLNAFVNKLKGGKKLRERMRKMMAEQKSKLDSDLQKAKK